MTEVMARYSAFSVFCYNGANFKLLFVEFNKNIMTCS